MLPHVAARPLNLERYPDGIAGRRIIQQRAGEYFPDWIERATVPKAGGTVTHVVASNAATLVYLAGQACITVHAWLSRVDRLDRPDRMIFDLDPSDGRSAGVRRAAREIGALLREVGLEPYAMTSGSRGFHITVPPQRDPDFDDVRSFAREVGAHRGRSRPDAHARAAQGRAWPSDLRRRHAQCLRAHGRRAYSARARPGAPVATPLNWDELSKTDTRPDRWTLRSIPDRLERAGDPWSEIQASASAGRAVAPAPDLVGDSPERDARVEPPNAP
jgi:bifunctional non-homologous end joining protein LigD